eukprot:3287217-Prymnesium_polylepis.1
MQLCRAAGPARPGCRKPLMQQTADAAPHRRLALVQLETCERPRCEPPPQLSAHTCLPQPHMPTCPAHAPAAVRASGPLHAEAQMTRWCCAATAAAQAPRHGAANTAWRGAAPDAPPPAHPRRTPTSSAHVPAAATSA